MAKGRKKTHKKGKRHVSSNSSFQNTSSFVSDFKEEAQLPLALPSWVRGASIFWGQIDSDETILYLTVDCPRPLSVEMTSEIVKNSTLISQYKETSPLYKDEQYVGARLFFALKKDCYLSEVLSLMKKRAFSSIDLSYERERIDHPVSSTLNRILSDLQKITPNFAASFEADSSRIDLDHHYNVNQIHFVDYAAVFCSLIRMRGVLKAFYEDIVSKISIFNFQAPSASRLLTIAEEMHALHTWCLKNNDYLSKLSMLPRVEKFFLEKDVLKTWFQIFRIQLSLPAWYRAVANTLDIFGVKSTEMTGWFEVSRKLSGADASPIERTDWFSSDSYNELTALLLSQSYSWHKNTVETLKKFKGILPGSQEAALSLKNALTQNDSLILPAYHPDATGKKRSLFRAVVLDAKQDDSSSLKEGINIVTGLEGLVEFAMGSQICYQDDELVASLACVDFPEPIFKSILNVIRKGKQDLMFFEADLFENEQYKSKIKTLLDLNNLLCVEFVKILDRDLERMRNKANAFLSSTGLPCFDNFCAPDAMFRWLVNQSETAAKNLFDQLQAEEKEATEKQQAVLNNIVRHTARFLENVADAKDEAVTGAGVSTTTAENTSPAADAPVGDEKRESDSLDNLNVLLGENKFDQVRAQCFRFLSQAESATPKEQIQWHCILATSWLGSLQVLDLNDPGNLPMASHYCTQAQEAFSSVDMLFNQNLSLHNDDELKSLVALQRNEVDFYIRLVGDSQARRNKKTILKKGRFYVSESENRQNGDAKPEAAASKKKKNTKKSAAQKQKEKAGQAFKRRQDDVSAQQVNQLFESVTWEPTGADVDEKPDGAQAALNTPIPFVSIPEQAPQRQQVASSSPALFSSQQEDSSLFRSSRMVNIHYLWDAGLRVICEKLFLSGLRFAFSGEFAQYLYQATETGQYLHEGLYFFHAQRQTGCDAVELNVHMDSFDALKQSIRAIKRQYPGFYYYVKEEVQDGKKVLSLFIPRENLSIRLNVIPCSEALCQIGDRRFSHEQVFVLDNGHVLCSKQFTAWNNHSAQTLEVTGEENAFPVYQKDIGLGLKALRMGVTQGLRMDQVSINNTAAIFREDAIDSKDKELITHCHQEMARMLQKKGSSFLGDFIDAYAMRTFFPAVYKMLADHEKQGASVAWFHHQMQRIDLERAKAPCNPLHLERVMSQFYAVLLAAPQVELLRQNTSITQNEFTLMCCNKDQMGSFLTGILDTPRCKNEMYFINIFRSEITQSQVKPAVPEEDSAWVTEAVEAIQENAAADAVMGMR